MVDDNDLDWHRVASAAAIEEEEPEQVKIGELLIALCKVDGEIYAINDICTHEYACLSDGFVEGDAIECPLHQARFHIPTGKVMDAPATEDVATYRVRLEGDDVWVGIPKA